MPTVSEVLRDPAFRSLSLPAQLRVLGKVDAGFTNLSEQAQLKVLEHSSQFTIPGTEKTGLPGIPAAPVPEMREQPGMLRSAAAGFVRGAASTATGTAKALSRAPGGVREQQVNQLVKQGMTPAQARQYIERTLQREESGAMPDAAEGIETDIGSAFGSGAGFLSTAALSPVAAAAAGVGLGTEEALSRADESGEDLTTGGRAGVALGGAALGSLEALPMGRLAGMLKRGGAVLPKGINLAELRKILYPTAKEYGKSAAVGFGGEAAQEGVSSVGQDVIEASYGGRQVGEIGEEFTKEASLGGLVGATFDVMMRAAGSRVGRVRLRRAGIDPDALLKMAPAEKALEAPAKVTVETLPAKTEFDAANERAVEAAKAQVSEQAETMAAEEIRQQTGLSAEAAPTEEAAGELWDAAVETVKHHEGPLGRAELVEALEVNYEDAGALLRMLSEEGHLRPVEVDGREMFAPYRPEPDPVADAIPPDVEADYIPPEYIPPDFEPDADISVDEEIRQDQAEPLASSKPDADVLWFEGNGRKVKVSHAPRGWMTVAQEGSIIAPARLHASKEEAIAQAQEMTAIDGKAPPPGKGVVQQQQSKPTSTEAGAIRRTGKTSLKDGTASPGVVGEGIALYEVPLSLIETTEDPVALGREGDIEQYQEQLSESEPPALFGSYDAGTGRVTLVSGHRRLEALRRAGREAARVAMTAGPDVQATSEAKAKGTPPPRKEVIQQPAKKRAEAGAPARKAVLPAQRRRIARGQHDTVTVEFPDVNSGFVFDAAAKANIRRSGGQNPRGVDSTLLRDFAENKAKAWLGITDPLAAWRLAVAYYEHVKALTKDQPAHSEADLTVSAPSIEQFMKSQSAGQANKTDRKPKTTPARGAEVAVAVPGEQQAYPARYALREADDVQTSHNPFSFEPNPEYQHRNDRNYRDPANAARVVQNSGENFDPAFLVTESPTAEHGATVVDPSGNALGGNNRAMTIKRVYAQHPRGAAAYRAALKAKAAQFGLKPEDVDRFNAPILVRERTETPADPQREITDYNKKGAAELNPNERAVTDGRRLSDRTVEAIVARLEDSGEGGTLADALRGDNGAEIINALVADGVITEGEKNAYVDERDQLTTEGKARIAKALVGRLFETSEQYANTPPEMRNKLERIAPQILRVEGRRGWALTGTVREALAVIEDARIHKIKSLDDLARQTTMDARRYSPEAIALAKALQQGPLKAAAAFRRYANDEALSRDGGQATFFAPPTQSEAFQDSFGDGPPTTLQMRPFRASSATTIRGKAAEADAVWRAGKHGKPGTLYLNQPGAELLKTALAPPGPTPRPAPLGESIPLLRAIAALRVLRRFGQLRQGKDPAVDKAIARVVEQLTQAIESGTDTIIVVQAGPGRSLGEVKRTHRHEQIHAAQQRLQPNWVGHVDAQEFFRHPAAVKAAGVLMTAYGTDEDVLATETATWIAAGQWLELGLSEKEARGVLWHYFDLLGKEHGDKALAVLARVQPKLRRQLHERTTQAIRKRAGRVLGKRAGRGEGRGLQSAKGDQGASLQQRDRQEFSGSRKESAQGRPGRVRPGVRPQARQEVAPLRGEFDPEGDRRKLERERLTAGFDAPLTPDEKRAKLKPAEPKQGGLFEAETGPEQGGLFGSDTGSIYLGGGLGAVQPFFDRLNRADLLNADRLARKLKGSVLAKAVDLMRPLESNIEREGDGEGRRLMRMLRRAGDRGEVNAGRRLVRLVDVKLDKLSREQRFNLVDVMQGVARPKDQAVADAFAAARSITDEIADEAEALQVKIRSGEGRVPFRRQPNYYPHLLRGPDALKNGPVRRDVIDNLVRLGDAVDKKDAESMLDAYINFVESGKRENRLLDHLVKTGQAPNRGEAFAMLKRMRTHVNRSGNLEFAREINLPFYDPDPARVLPMHVAASSIRLAQVAELGQDNQVVNREVKRIADAGGNADFVRKAVDSIIGFANGADAKDMAVSRVLRAFQGFKLGLAQIPNSTQGVLNGMLAADLPSVAAGLKAAASKSGWRFAIESGATIDPILHESVRELVAGNRTLEHYLRATGFTASERFNRVLAANTGAVYAQRMLGRLKVNPKHKRAQRALAELIGREATERAIRTKKLGADDVLMAAKRFSDLTQFRSRPQDIPEFASTPWGKVFFQFKSFSYNQTKLLYRTTVGEFKRGEFGRGLRNLLILGTLFPLTGEAIRQLRALLTGRELKEEGLARYLEAAASVGSLGILYDMIESGSNRRGSEFLLGPTGGDVARLMDVAAAKNKTKAAGRWLKQRTPLTRVAERLLALGD